MDYILLLILILLGFVVYSLFFKKDGGVTIKEAKRLLKNREVDYIVDVRSLSEWNEHNLTQYSDTHWKIPVIHIPIDRLVFDLESKIEDTNPGDVRLHACITPTGLIRFEK